MTASFREVAVSIARRAGALLQANLGRVHRIEQKDSPTNLVTEMDRRAEALIVSALSARFPDHAILTEEAGTLGRDGDHRWVIDPLDGTTNYAHGLPIYAVSTGSGSFGSAPGTSRRAGSWCRRRAGA